MNPLLIALIAVGVAILLIILITIIWYVSTLNALRSLEVKVHEAESGIDVALTKRHDLLTKTLSATKGYIKHETSTLEKIVQMRLPKTDSTIAEKSTFASEQTKGLQNLAVIVENYPDLKANVQFSKLQDASAETEENLQAARRIYNSNISILNRKIVVWPNNIIAKNRGFVKRDFFEADEVKRADVAFDF